MEKRFILFIVACLLVVQVTTWYMRKYQPAPASTPAAQQERTTPATDGALPQTELKAVTAADASTATLAAAAVVPVSTPQPSVEVKGEPVEFNTEVYKITFDTRGAVPTAWSICDPRFTPPPEHDDQGNVINEGACEELIDPALNDQPGMPRLFQTVLKELNARYHTEFNTGFYTSEPFGRDGKVGMRFTSRPNELGLQMVKTYLFDPKGYLGHLEIELVNQGTSRLTFSGDEGRTGLGLTLGPGLGIASTKSSPASNFAKVDAVVSSGENFEYELPTEAGESEDFTMSRIQWGGVQNMYFLAALVASEGQDPFSFARVRVDRNVPALFPQFTDKEKKRLISHYPTLELYSGVFTIEPGQRMNFSYEMYMGPKQQELLGAAGHDLSRILFYNSWGWFRALCLGLMKLLTWFHGLVGNWGVAIILLTVLVKLVTFPLVHKGMKSQAKMTAEMAKIKPLMDKVNQKYANDPQRKQQELFKLYKEHNINPLGMFKGCVWLGIQMPIFIALYRLLYASIDIRGGSFLWVTDLAQPDKLFALPFVLPFIGSYFNLLPIITGVTQMLVSKFTTTVASDPQQEQMQKMMIYFMPIMILFFTYQFPAGLMLYWLVSNFWQVLQQIWVNKVIKKPDPTAPAARPAR